MHRIKAAQRASENAQDDVPERGDDGEADALEEAEDEEEEHGGGLRDGQVHGRGDDGGPRHDPDLGGAAVESIDWWRKDDFFDKMHSSYVG